MEIIFRWDAAVEIFSKMKINKVDFDLSYSNWNSKILVNRNTLNHSREVPCNLINMYKIVPPGTLLVPTLIHLYLKNI